MTIPPNELITIDNLPDIYNTYLRDITAFIYSIMYDEEATQHIIHDLFYTLWLDLKDAKLTAENVRAYLFKTSRNLCIEEIKRKKAAKELFENTPAYLKDEVSLEDMPIDSILLDEIFSFIEKNCSKTDLTVFKLIYYYNLNLREAAQVINSSIPAVTKILKNISQKIGNEFQDITK